MNERFKSKLLLVDKEEFLYVFKYGIIEPFIVNIDKNLKEDFEFIITSNNKFIFEYLEALNDFQEGKINQEYLYLIREKLSLEDISKNPDKVRDVETIVTDIADLNLIDAENIIPKSFEVTFVNDFRIVKTVSNFRPYFQNIESSKSLFENAVLFKTFLEEHLNMSLDYFSFHKYLSPDSYNPQLYVNFVGPNNNQYFIKDSLLYAMINSCEMNFLELYETKNCSDYRNDAISICNNYQIVQNNIINNLIKLNEENKNYLSSNETSFLFKCSLTAFACSNNPCLAPALIFLPLSEELAVSSLNKFMTDVLHIDEDSANFVSKTSFFLFKSGLSNLNLDSNIIQCILNKDTTEKVFIEMLEKSNLDLNKKRLIALIYQETRDTDFDNLSLFKINQKSEIIINNLGLTKNKTKAIQDMMEEYSKDLAINIVSAHPSYIINEKTEKMEIKSEENSKQNEKQRKEIEEGFQKNKQKLIKKQSSNQFDSDFGEL